MHRALVSAAAAAGLLLSALPATADEPVPLPPCEAVEGATVITVAGHKDAFTATLTPSPLGSTGDGTPVNDTLDPGATRRSTYQLDLSDAPLTKDGLQTRSADLLVLASWDDDVHLSDYDLYVYDGEGNQHGQSISFNPGDQTSSEEVLASRVAHCELVVVDFVSASGVPGQAVEIDLTSRRLRS